MDFARHISSRTNSLPPVAIAAAASTSEVSKTRHHLALSRAAGGRRLSSFPSVPAAFRSAPPMARRTSDHGRRCSEVVQAARGDPRWPTALHRPRQPRGLYESVDGGGRPAVSFCIVLASGAGPPGPVCYHDQVGRGSPMVVEVLARETGAGRWRWDDRLLLAVMC